MGREGEVGGRGRARNYRRINEKSGRDIRISVTKRELSLLTCHRPMKDLAAGLLHRVENFYLQLCGYTGQAALTKSSL